MADGQSYQCKGDPFTLKVRRGEGPLTVIRWNHNGTGREPFARVPMHRCAAFKVSDVLSAVHVVGEHLPSLQGAPLGQLAPLLALDWQPSGGRVKLALREQPRELRAEARVMLDVTGTDREGTRGERL